MTFKINKRKSKGITKQHYKVAKSLKDFADDNDFTFVPWENPLTQRRTWTSLVGFEPDPVLGDSYDKFNLVLEHDKNGKVDMITYSEVDGLSITAYVDNVHEFLDALGEKRWLSDDFEDWRWNQTPGSLASKIGSLPGIDQDPDEVSDPINVSFGRNSGYA